MAGKGGARPGAGRKPKAEKYATAINKAEKRIADRLPLLVDRMLDLAEGVLSEEFDLIRMKQRVYKAPPDRHAIEYLINRIMGKPTEKQEIEMSGPGGGTIPISVERSIEQVYGDDTGDDNHAPGR